MEHSLKLTIGVRLDKNSAIDCRQLDVIRRKNVTESSGTAHFMWCELTSRLSCRC